MIDFHCHILPGIDDGAADMSESVKMAAVLSSFGFTEIYCTPHRIKGSYDNDPAEVLENTLKLQDILDRQGVSVVVHPGMEYYIDEFFVSSLEDPVLRESGMVLFEAPAGVDPEILKDAVYQITRRELMPVLAHPERCRTLSVPVRRWFSFRKEETLLAETLRGMGCHFQANIGSFMGLYGREVMHTALSYLERGIYSFLGSDGHSSDHIVKILEKGMQKVEEISGREGMERLFTGDGLLISRERREKTSVIRCL